MWKNLNAEFYRYKIGTFDLMVFALIEFIFEKKIDAFDQMKEFDLIWFEKFDEAK